MKYFKIVKTYVKHYFWQLFWYSDTQYIIKQQNYLSFSVGYMINNSQTYMYYMAGLEKAVIVRNRMRDGLAVQRFNAFEPV